MSFALVAAVLVAGCSVTEPTDMPPPVPARVLVFSKTAGFRHASIPAGIGAIRALGARGGFEVEATEETTVFTDAGLAAFDAVVFLSTSDDVLNEDEQDAFERFMASGGGWAGIHGASATETDWDFYSDLLGGAYFASHPPVQEAVLDITESGHPSTSSLPDRWTWSDEWYAFRQRPEGVRVLLTVDETTYDGGTMGADHPISWCHERLGGRAWYTALGHRAEGYPDATFREHLLGGIRYAAGLEPGTCG